MRRSLIILWLLVPLVALAIHVGPGQRWQAQATADERWRAAEHAAAYGDWMAAGAALTDARAALSRDDHRADADPAAGMPAAPASTEAATILALAHARARIRAGELPEGIAALEDVLAAQPGNATASPLAQVARAELATAHYHAAWLMRREGAAPDEWQIEAEAARQQFRLLAEHGDPQQADSAARNLEATVRLQRMDLSELQGLPLPKNCPNQCQNLSQRRRKQRESRGACQQPSKSQEPQDARKQVKEASNNAGLQQALSGAGS